MLRLCVAVLFLTSACAVAAQDRYIAQDHVVNLSAGAQNSYRSHVLIIDRVDQVAYVCYAHYIIGGPKPADRVRINAVGSLCLGHALSGTEGSGAVLGSLRNMRGPATLATGTYAETWWSVANKKVTFCALRISGFPEASKACIELTPRMM